MPKLTGVIDKISRERISDFTLYNDLILIRGATESVYNNYKFPTIEKCTENWVEFTEKVASFVDDLLKKNTDFEFSEQEIFLLLAGTFFNNIGIMCDYNKYPEVKKKAVDLGAKFDIISPVEEKNEFSLKKLDEIYTNYSFLSASWVEYLCEIRSQPLSLAIESMYNCVNLVEDLSFLYTFHSKSAIDDCDDYSELNTWCRKKIVAAILHIATELAIISTNVEIDNIEIPPLNKT